MSKPILALNSIRGKSGKDTLIGHIEAEGLKVHRVAFADILKKELAQVLAFPGVLRAGDLLRLAHSSDKDTPYACFSVRSVADCQYADWLWTTYIEDPSDLDVPRSLRWHLQVYGTEYVREYLNRPNYWLDAGYLEVLNGASDPSVDVVVVTDMRLPNEYTRMSTAGASLIRIVRAWHVPEVDTVPYHQSDIALMAHPFDALVVNEWGKPEAMFPQIKRFL